MRKFLKVNKFIRLLWLVNLICLVGNTPSQSVPENWSEIGLPHTQNFKPTDYGADPQIFRITQDKRGILYFANDEGILEYDGINWRLIEVTQQRLIRSVCYTNGVLYIGGQDDLGYLSPDARGSLKFVSLKEKIPEEARNFKGIWDIVAIKDTIFFRSYFAVFRWANNRMTVWKPKFVFHNIYSVFDKFFVREVKVGLKMLINDSFVLVPGGERFSIEPIAAMLPLEDSKILIITRFQGWFLYDGQTFQEYPTQADEFVKSSLIIHAVLLPDNKIALATQRSGLGLMDLQGNLLQVIDKSSGLRGKILNYVYLDQQDGLWLALSNGIARVEFPSPISRFTEIHGLQGAIFDVIRFRGKLYAATNMGVFRFEANPGSLPQFQQIEGINNTAYSFIDHNGKLFIGTHLGLYLMEETRAVSTDFFMESDRLSASVICLRSSLKNKQRIYVGTYQGLYLLKEQKTGGYDIRKVPDFEEYVIDVLEDSTGGLWVGTRRGAFYISKPDLYFSNPDDSSRVLITRYGKIQGLVEKSLRPVRISDRILFATSAGLHQFDPIQKRFLPDTTLGSPLADTACTVYHVQEDHEGNIMVIGKRGIKAVIGQFMRHSDGSYRWESAPFTQLQDLGDIHAIYPDKDGVLWFGGTEGLYRYSPLIEKNYAVDFPALIRRVIINGDSIIFGSGSVSVLSEADLNSSGTSPIQLSSANVVRFEFAAPAYDATYKNRFKVFLEGFDTEWSTWSSESYKDYTGLAPGKYIFQVRAQNAYGHMGQTDKFNFSILPPWYRSWWAYLIYSIGVIGIIGLLFKLRVRQLQIKTQRLELLVSERTETIREQADKLEELDRLKSRFFANISHEFRTPLTLILGPLEDLISQTKDRTTQGSLRLMQRNAQRLLHLINQLLDLSRLESGRLTLHVCRGDLIGSIKGIVMSFASLAERNDIKLSFQDQFKSGDLSNIYFDQDKIEKILVNLIFNAIKFTPAGGDVAVCVNSLTDAASVDKKRQEKNRFEENQIVEIIVSDTGSGISAEQLPYIFERFYQSEVGRNMAREGTGIGLALVKELIELHHGTIEVKSESGRGTEFIIRLPLGKANFSQEEIVDEPPVLESIEAAGPVQMELVEETFTDEIVPASPTDLEGSDENDTIVLVVDDHPDVRRYIKQHLDTSFSVMEARDGKEGVDMALELVPDLVISDVMMPHMNGFELCLILKTQQQTSHIPVILLTAKAEEQDKLEGLETGADDYLVKPFNSKELQMRVTNLIESRRKLRERFRREGILQPRGIVSPSASEAFMQKLMVTLEENLAEEDLGVEKLSQLLYMSRRQLHRKIRALNGQSPTDLIRSVRLQRAYQMLEQQTGTVSEIAFAVGFNNLSYFSKSFREEFGKTPSDFLKDR